MKRLLEVPCKISLYYIWFIQIALLCCLQTLNVFHSLVFMTLPTIPMFCTYIHLKTIHAVDPNYVTTQAGLVLQVDLFAAQVVNLTFENSKQCQKKVS